MIMNFKHIYKKAKNNLAECLLSARAVGLALALIIAVLVAYAWECFVKFFAPNYYESDDYKPEGIF